MDYDVPPKTATATAVITVNLSGYMNYAPIANAGGPYIAKIGNDVLAPKPLLAALELIRKYAGQTLRRYTQPQQSCGARLCLLGCKLFNQAEFHVADDIIFIFKPVFPLVSIASSDKYVIPGHPCEVS